MSLPIIIALSLCSVLAILLTLSKIISMKTIIRYGALIDVVTTVVFFVVFQGTLGGTLVAVMSGLIMAIFLSAAKSYWNWAYANGHISEPLKAPKAPKTKKTVAIITKDEAQTALNQRIHGSVVGISSFIANSRKAA